MNITAYFDRILLADLLRPVVETFRDSIALSSYYERKETPPTVFWFDRNLPQEDAIASAVTADKLTPELYRNSCASGSGARDAYRRLMGEANA